MARLHGVWGLGIVARWHPPRAAECVSLLLPFLEDEEAEVRAQGAKVLGDLRAAEALPGLRQGLKDGSARVQLQSALALGRLGDQAAGAAAELFALAGLHGEADPVLRHGAVMGLVGCAPHAEVLERVAHANRGDRMAALLVLRRRADANLARFLDDPDPLLRREAATAIHDLPVPAAMEALAAHIEGDGLEGSALVRRVLNANLILGTEEHAGRLARFALRDDQDPVHRAEALEMLALWADPPNVDRVLGRFVDLGPRDTSELAGRTSALAAAMASAPAEVLEAWIALAVAAEAAVLPDLVTLAREEARPASTRVAALRALESLGADGLRTSVGEALTTADGLVRAAALDILQRLSPEEALPLFRLVLERGEWPERRTAYRALGTLDHPEAEALLVHELDRLAADLVPAEVTLDLVLAAEARGGTELERRLEAHRAPRAADPELAPWLDGLFGGDRAAGRRIFRESIDLSCLRCHEVQDADAPRIGPSLEGVGQRLTSLQLLESIVQPNRRITAGYETTTFFLTDGEIIEGLVIAEDADALVVVDSDGGIWDIETADIDESRPGLSAMPEDLGKSLTREQMRDLLAYLRSL